MKTIKLIFLGLLLTPGLALAANVEVVLKSKLDGNLSGYCIDIKGGFANIDPSRGLQAHTCLSYRGDGTLGDQAMEVALFENGVLKFPEYEVCATATEPNIGDELSLTACDGSDAQNFVITENGTISPANATSICLTAGDETTFGRNGTSPHQIKTLTFQNCDAELAGHQEWRTRVDSDDVYTQ